VPSGYLVDAGQLYGSRGNGQTYGWSLDRTPDTRERNVDPDQRYDTLVHMKRLNQVPAANWDLALPNGQYTVRLVMGDSSFQDQTNHIRIEGVTYTDTDPYDDDQEVDAFGDFDEVTRTVTITDGKLTLSPSSGCYNTKLVFIEVTPLSGGEGTATPGLAAATYKYDALGRRLQKTVGGVGTTFVHDGDQVVAEYEGSTLKRRYIYGTYIDEPLAMVTSAGTQYYHQSRIYSVMALSNQSGQLAERYGYTPYGKRRVVSPGGATLAASAVGNQVGFTGRYHDGETQLTYFRARYQDAELGRFVGRDPIGYADAVIRLHGTRRRDGQTLAYGYARGTPAFFVDPSGEVVDLSQMSPQGKMDYEAAKACLATAGDNALARLEALPQTVYLTDNSRGVNEFRAPPEGASGTDTINWDPRSGDVVGDDRVQSPAVSLLHEAAHAENKLTDPKAFYDRSKAQDLTKYDVSFPNAEEGYVALGEETKIAEALGEPTRVDYSAKSVRVDSPVSNQCR